MGTDNTNDENLMKPIHDEIINLRKSIDDFNLKLTNISAQNRPWISITDGSVKYKLENNLLTLFFKNFGNTPALNLQLKGLTSSENDIDQDALTKRPSTQSFAIAPQESFSYSLDTSQEKIISAAKENSLYFGVEIGYSFNDDLHGVTVLIGHVHIASNLGMIYSTKILK